MTQEEFYIWLLNCDSGSKMNSLELGINLEFLKNYEISKLILEKIGIHNLYKHEQKYLNLDAISSWVMFSDYIYLKYDIPEILELLPERIVGYLDLRNSEIKSLPQLKSVGGSLDLSCSNVQSLPALKSIEGNLYLRDLKIQSLPKLESVGKSIYAGDDRVSYWKSYFGETGRPHLTKKVCW